MHNGGAICDATCARINIRVGGGWWGVEEVFLWLARFFFLLSKGGGGWVRGSWAVHIICGCLLVCVGGGKRYVRKEGVESGMGKLCELGFYASF